MLTGLAKLANILLVGWFLYMLSQHGMPKGNDVAVWLVLAVPLINLFALMGASNSDAWLSLLLRRLALEEKMKISRIKEKEGQ